MFFQSSRCSPSLWLITACPPGLVTPRAPPPLPQSCVFWMASPRSHLSYGLFPSYLSSKSSENMLSTDSLLHCFPELFQTFFLRNLDHFEEFAIGQEVDVYSLLKFLPRAVEKILPYGYAKSTQGSSRYGTWRWLPISPDYKQQCRKLILVFLCEHLWLVSDDKFLEIAWAHFGTFCIRCQNVLQKDHTNLELHNGIWQHSLPTLYIILFWSLAIAILICISLITTKIEFLFYEESFSFLFLLL